jgi:hypothetical protein
MQEWEKTYAEIESGRRESNPHKANLSSEQKQKQVVVITSVQPDEAAEPALVISSVGSHGEGALAFLKVISCMPVRL